MVDKGAMNDRDVYLKLAAVAEELMTLSEAAESYVGEAALRTAASTIAGTARRFMIMSWALTTRIDRQEHGPLVRKTDKP